jgi:hypothetical protein
MEHPCERTASEELYRVFERDPATTATVGLAERERKHLDARIGEFDLELAISDGEFIPLAVPANAF